MQTLLPKKLDQVRRVIRLRQVIDRVLAEAPDRDIGKEPTRSLRGLLSKYGPAPSAEEIDENRAEMFANFPRSGFL